MIYDNKNLYKNIKNIMLENSQVVIFGAGSYGKIIYELLNKMGYSNKIVAFCDNDSKKVGGGQYME